MPIRLIRLISTQKVLKTYINKGVKWHFLGSNQVESPENCCFGLLSSPFHPRTINTHFLGF